MKIAQETENGNSKVVEVGTYLIDIFESYYSELILNFGGIEELMESFGE
jgi:hypothetical protein